jgi:ribosomal-protein-alanine N-acetyltransferase
VTPSELATLHAACFTAPRPWTAQEFETILGQAHVFLLTQAGGFLVGRAAGGEAELLTLAVPPDARRTGTGGLLVENFLYQAKLMGAEHAFLEVSTQNAAAIALYRQNGFETVATRTAYMTGTDGLAHDAFVMGCTIGHDAR